MPLSPAEPIRLYIGAMTNGIRGGEHIVLASPRHDSQPSVGGIIVDADPVLTASVEAPEVLIHLGFSVVVIPVALARSFVPAPRAAPVDRLLAFRYE